MKIWLIFFVCFITILFRIVSGEYYINNHIPSYMHKYYNNVTEEIFPMDIRINMSLSNFDGDLLYSIDKTNNQLIMTLTDAVTPTIRITFRNEKHDMNFTTLCGCQKCKNEIINLRIRIKSEIEIQCNNKTHHYPINNNTKPNKAYPLGPFYNETTKEAHLWIVNYPTYPNNFHNSKQLRGCIFNVLYNDKEIEFTSLNGTVKKKCRRTCIGDICNGGQCYETYNDVPLCDCAKTFLSGKYCNDSAVLINIRKSYNLQRNMLKFSWKSHSKDLLSLNNANVDIRLEFDFSKLIFQYKEINGQMNNEIILSSSYVQNEEHILILNLVENTLEFYNNTHWFNKTIPTKRNLKNEMFNLTMESCEGYIDLFGKNIPAVVWTKEDIKYESTIMNDKKGTCSKNLKNQKEIIKQSTTDGTVVTQPGTTLPMTSKNNEAEQKKIIDQLTIALSVSLVLLWLSILTVVSVVLYLYKRKKLCFQAAQSPPPTTAEQEFRRKLIEILENSGVICKAGTSSGVQIDVTSAVQQSQDTPDRTQGENQEMVPFLPGTSSGVQIDVTSAVQQSQATTSPPQTTPEQEFRRKLIEILENSGVICKADEGVAESTV